MTTMTDEQLAAIRARCSAVPDTKLIMLDSDNDLFDELAIHMVRDQLLVGEIAWLNKDDVSRAYGEIFAHARADIPALLAYIDELRAEVERLRDAKEGEAVSDDELKAIRARCEAATPGPWIREGAVISSLRGVWYALKASADRADLSLMFHACEDIPALLAEVERLMEDVDALHRECARLYEIEDEHRKCPL